MHPNPGEAAGAEIRRLAEDARREKNWKRWGPYLAERQWGTVREDYSPDGRAWDYFPHDHARSRAYRWGEDGLLGISDRQGRLCFALALWNGKDPILKERLFGLSGSEGNHGEDVKECYYFLDATPTHSYLAALYKYPHSEFPYARLVAENRARSRNEPEFELVDTGVFDQNRYFDVRVEYAKAGPEDVLVRIEAWNRGPDAAELHVIPTIWFRNTWSWGRVGEEHGAKPSIRRGRGDALEMLHEELGEYRLSADTGPDGASPELLFTDNETNAERLFGSPNSTPFVKDAFHESIVGGRKDRASLEGEGTKAAAHYRVRIPPAASIVLRLRLSASAEAPSKPFGPEFDLVFEARKREADAFYESKIPAKLSREEKSVARQAYAGLIWSKQFYHYVVEDWLEGDPVCPPPPPEREQGRNRDWRHLYCRDVLAMPDTWEFPWFAAWDLAFQTLPLARLDPEFAKHQLELLLREWYMHPSGQVPAYEWAFSDVNPPVHAWACWRVYKKSGHSGKRDVRFLASCFQKLLINFTWWVNRKDEDGRHLFSGGFLGLDNIGVFDRSKPLPTGGHLEQADGTAWMAFYCGTMLSMAIELARHEPGYEDMASRFLEHFVHIADAMNELGGSGLWDPADGFYYDQVCAGGEVLPLRVRSIVGLIPLVAVEVLEEESIDRMPGFKKRLEWFLENRKDLARHIGYLERGGEGRRLLAIPSRERLELVLRYLLDENEFLSPYGVRSVSKVHEKHPFVLEVQGIERRIEYTPGESTTALFGGNSNWRGPVWFPVNYLIVEALERYHHFYGETLTVELPTGSGRRVTLREAASEIAGRLTRIFLPDASGRRPCHGADRRYQQDPRWRDLVLFYEHFHGDDGRGIGASHQTGWTALVASLLEGHPADARVTSSFGRAPPQP